MNYGRYQEKTVRRTVRRRHFLLNFGVALALIILCWIWLGQGKHTTLAVTSQTTNYCALNKLNQNIIVSISKRHMWACAGNKTAYDAKVVTGMEKLPADLTPTGTYHIAAKQTDLHLTGSDTTGSWDDYVYYWLPFLTNQYGKYGFHDATWRKDSDFGNIDPNSSSGSHGCVEMPFAAAKWLYYWANVGATVTINA